jgi:ribonuclease P protein component
MVCTYPKLHRLCKKNQIDNAFSSKKRLSFDCISIAVTRNQQNHPRLGLIVSKKILPLAVSRNLFKRVIREEFRTHSELLQNMDFVVIAKRNLTGLTAEQMKICLRKSLEKLILQLKR